MTVKLLHCLIVQSGVIGLITAFIHIVLVKYVTNTLVKTNHAAPILQLNLVILATLREYSNSFLY